MKKRASKQKLRRGTILKTIETPAILALLEVPVVYFPNEPDEAYLEPKTVKLLDEARRRAKAGDTAWLKRRGAKVYVSSPAA